jgi:hypothetical protein
MTTASSVLITLAFLAVGTTAQHLAGTAIGFVAPVIPTLTTPVLITVFGTNISEYTAFRLATNTTTTKCDTGTAYAIGAAPPGTISNIVRWTKHDPSDFLVASFTTSVENAQVYVCYTRDGRHWFPAANNQSRQHFHLWRKQPTVEYHTPLTPTVGNPIQIFVRNVAPGSIGALTKQTDGCDGTAVANTVLGCSSAVLDATTLAFTFTPLETATTVYLCVASNSKLNDWSLIPFNWGLSRSAPPPYGRRWVHSHVACLSPEATRRAGCPSTTQVSSRSPRATSRSVA